MSYDHELKRIATALERIAESLEIIANPPMKIDYSDMVRPHVQPLDVNEVFDPYVVTCKPGENID